MMKSLFDSDRFFPERPALTEPSANLFEERRSSYLEASKAYLAHYRQWIRQLHIDGADGEQIVRLTSTMFDVLVRKLIRNIILDTMPLRSGSEQITLVALGGYGRAELNPFSDLDIMFLYKGKDASWVEGLAQKMLYFLWDMRLDVGYSVRTIQDCIDMAGSDLTVKTALLDARFISGSRQLMAELEKALLTQVLAKGSDSFIRDKVEEMRSRRKRFGSSVYLLEPNIKECEGGLRDLHTALWVAKIRYKVANLKELVIKGIISEEEQTELEQALAYLWRIRNELHYLSGRKNDQLTFEAQPQIAAFLGFADSGRTLAVEAFMRDYYLHASRFEHISASLVAKCSRREQGPFKILGYFTRRPLGDGIYVLKGELTVPDETVITENPHLLMKLFEHAQKQQVVLGYAVKTLIRKNLHLVNDRFRRSREVNSSFFAILRNERGVDETLMLMHHLEFLGQFIPEFGRIYCKVQHDLYHIYTVDIHSIFAVAEIARLWRGEHAADLPLLTKVAREVDKREMLLLAVLLHDVGKGDGGGHAERGAAMMPAIARRMGLSKEDSERLEFLVRHHILMAHIAQRRDLNDEKMIMQFARQMEKSETLKMLYLLTYADIRAVGPDVWTDWKASLTQELFEKSFEMLERGDFHLEAHSERARKVRKSLLEELGEEFSPAQVKDELAAMSTRHLLSYGQKELAGHLRMLLSLDDEKLLITVAHDRDHGYSNVIICTFDLPGLFSMITGVMAANGINILGAQINTSSNGKALDILQVNSGRGLVIDDPSRWQRFETDMRDVLEGKVRVQTLVEKRRSGTSLPVPTRPRFPSRVDIDNEVSERYTVIDIYTHDKVGLLYHITSTLTELGLYIGVSRISTKVDQVADVFYVRDIFGHKITALEKLDEIRRRLLEAVDAP
jgi:[protein-PII] uridylyltransferase